MKCLLTLMISSKNFATLAALYLVLRVLQAFNPASPLPFVLTPSNSDFIVVMWPARPASRSRRQEHPRMSSERLSPWWSALWKLSKTLATPGKLGVADGIPATPSTLNFQEPQKVTATNLKA